MDTPSSFASGPSANDHRHKLIKACIEAFKSKLLKMSPVRIFNCGSVNVIVVVGHEKLNVEMQRAYGANITVVKIPKSGGVGHLRSKKVYILIRPQVVEIDQAYRDRVINYQLYTYFYGHIIKPPTGVANGTLGGENLGDLVLSPSSTMVNFGDLSIYRIGSGKEQRFSLFCKIQTNIDMFYSRIDTMAPSDVLPVGATRTVSEMQPASVDPGAPSSRLTNGVLALLSLPSEDEGERYDEELLDLAVVGFLVV